MEFEYAARTVAGAAIRGSVAASDASEALAGLQRRALYVTRVAPKRRNPFAVALPAFSFGRARAHIGFFRSFSTLVRAGVPLRRGLDVAVERCTYAPLATALRDVAAAIERGESLSAAFARHPAVFSALTTAMIAAGESGGILDDVLERIAGFLERDDALRKSVSSALAYPAVVLSASLALVTFLIVRIVPMFSAMFASFHVPLPLSTRILMAIGDAAMQPPCWSIALVVAAAATAASVYAARTERGRFGFDRARLALPVAGPLLRKTIVARFARMTGTLVHSGIELSAALEVVIPVLGSPVHQAALARVGTALREGETFSVPLAATGVFDPMLVALAGVGEETGMLDILLPKAADYFEADVAATIATLGAVIEPALIGVLGAIVGLIMYAVFIPLYSQTVAIVST